MRRCSTTSVGIRKGTNIKKKRTNRPIGEQGGRINMRKYAAEIHGEKKQGKEEKETNMTAVGDDKRAEERDVAEYICEIKIGILQEEKG